MKPDTLDLFKDILLGGSFNNTCNTSDITFWSADDSEYSCFYHACKEVEKVARFSLYAGGGAFLLLVVIILLLLVIVCFMRYKLKKLRR